MSVAYLAPVDVEIHTVPKSSMHEILERAEAISIEYPSLEREPAACIYVAVGELERSDCGFINPLVDPIGFWNQWRDTFSHAFYDESIKVEGTCYGYV